MDIQRINEYNDPRFPQEILYQHGAYLVDGAPCQKRNWRFSIMFEMIPFTRSRGVDLYRPFRDLEELEASAPRPRRRR